MCNRIRFTRFALAAALAGSTSVCAAQVKWDLPTGYGASSFQTQNVQAFADEVNAAIGGKLNITVHPGGSLYKANEIKRAIQTSQVPIGEFILSGAANENALFGVDSIPFLADSYKKARRLSEISRPALEKLLGKQGMKLLYVSPWPGQSLYSIKPIASAADLKGTKMRAYNPTTSRIAQLVGAQPTTIQLAELPQAIATGTVDNFLTSSASGVESKLYEMVKNFYIVNAWLPRNAVVVQVKAFEKLDAAARKAVLKAAANAEKRGWATSEQKNAEYLKTLAEKGMNVSEPSPALAADLQKVGVAMTAEWLKQAGPEGKAVVDAYLAK